MPGFKIEQVQSGSINDNSLTLFGDPNTGKLSQTGFKAVADYISTHVSGSGGGSGSTYDPTQLNLFTSSIELQVTNTFASESNYLPTGSYLVDSSSFLAKIVSATYNAGNINAFSASLLTFTGSILNNLNNVFASESNYTTTQSFQTLSSSFNSDSSSVNTQISTINVQVANTFSSQSNYELTGSFNTFSSSYHADSTSFDSRINNVTGSGGSYNPAQLNAFSSSILSYTSSINTQITNVFASESNYTPSSSFLALSSSYHSDSGSFYTNINTVSVGLNTVSQALSVETATRLANDNTISNNLSIETVNRISGDNSLSVNINTVSNAVSIVSQALSLETANRISAVNVVSNAVSIVSQALSLETANRVSAINVVSNAVSIVSQALSVETTNRISGDNALSNAISIVSVAAAGKNLKITIENQGSVLTTNPTTINFIGGSSTFLSGAVVKVNPGTGGGGGSVTSANFVSLKSVVQANSAQMTSADNAISNAVSVETVNRISGDNALSANINVVSNAVSIVSAALAGEITNRSNAVNTVSNTLSIETANRISSNFLPFTTQTDTNYTLVLGDGNTGIKFNNSGSRTLAVPSSSIVNFPLGTQIVLEQFNTGSITVSGSGTGVTLQGQSLVTGGQYSNIVLIKQAQDTWFVGGNTGGGTTSVTSAKLANVLSAVLANSAQMTSANNAISNTLSIETANRISAVQALSTVFANNLSVISQNISVLSVAAANISNNISNLQSAVNVLSNSLSVLSNQVSAAGGFQQIAVQNNQSISTSALTNVSGLSVSIAANGAYKIEAYLLYNLSVASTAGYSFALVASGITQNNAAGNWQGISAMGVSTGGAGIALVNEPFNGLSGAAYTVASAQLDAVAYLKLEALIAASTTGGSLQIQAKTTLAANSLEIYKGSFIKAWRVV